MNTREKTLLFTLVGIVLIGVFGLGGWKFVYDPYKTKHGGPGRLERHGD